MDNTEAHQATTDSVRQVVSCSACDWRGRRVVGGDDKPCPACGAGAIKRHPIQPRNTPSSGPGAQLPLPEQRNGRKVYRPREFARLIGRSVSTLKNWERKGTLVAHRYPSGQRYYTSDQLESFFGSATEPAS